MKRSTFSILFYVNRSKMKKNGCCPIMGRISVDGKASVFSTGHETEPSLWDVKKGEVSSKATGAKETNRALAGTREKLQSYYNIILERDGFITAERLKNELSGVTAKSTGLLACACGLKDEIMKSCGITRTPSTCAIWKRIYDILHDYVSNRLGKDDIPFAGLEYSFIEDYGFFLKTERKLSPRTVAKYMMLLRRTVRHAIMEKMIVRDPFDGYRTPGRAETTRKWLGMKELNAIMTTPVPDKTANFVRHMFVFSCLTGLSRVDIDNLKESDIQSNGYGGKEIRIRRQKTGTPCIVPLGKIPLQIIELYKGREQGSKLFPRLTGARACRSCKRIAAMAGLEVNLTFHQGRHSYATLCLSKGMGIETLSSILGHRSIKVTQIYAKVTNRKIAEDMEAVARAMEKHAGKYVSTDVNPERPVAVSNN